MQVSAHEPKVIVYRAQNLVNGKRYIGVTMNGLRTRIKSHMYLANNGKGHAFHDALRKYGRDKFSFETLADFIDDYDLAKVYEWEMICKHRPEYNLTSGGEGGGFAASTIEKMRAAKLGKKHRPEVIAARLGRKHSEEHCRKISLALTGKPPTKGRTGMPLPPETREKIRQTLKQATWVDTPARVASRNRTGASAASEARKIPVKCVSDGLVFESIKAAAKFYHNDQVQLARAVRAGKPYGGRFFALLPKEPGSRYTAT
jgi:group I intron endonuclease